MNNIRSKEDIQAILAVRLTQLENDRDKNLLDFKKQYQKILTDHYGDEPLQLNGIEHLLMASGDSTVKAIRKLDWLQGISVTLDTWDFVDWCDGLFRDQTIDVDANFRRFKIDILKRIFIGCMA